jgi:hypothetical protein
MVPSVRIREIKQSNYCLLNFWLDRTTVNQDNTELLNIKTQIRERTIIGFESLNKF